MIANFFNKTKPVNVFNVVVLLFVYYFISFFLQDSGEFSTYFLVERIGVVLLIILFLVIFKFIIEKNKLFDAAFWVGVATLIYSWSIFYILLIYIGIIIYRKISFKNLVIPVIGLATPIFIYFTYTLLYDNLTVFYSRFNYDASLVFVNYNSFKFLIPITFLITILLWSIVTITPKIISVSNKFKFSWNVLINHLIISLLIVVLSPIKNGSEMFYLVFPSAIIITNFLQKSKSSTFKNMVLYLFLIISVSVYFL